MKIIVILPLLLVAAYAYAQNHLDDDDDDDDKDDSPLDLIQQEFGQKPRRKSDSSSSSPSSSSSGLSSSGGSSSSSGSSLSDYSPSRNFPSPADSLGTPVRPSQPDYDGGGFPSSGQSSSSPFGDPMPSGLPPLEATTMSPFGSVTTALPSTLAVPIAGSADGDHLRQPPGGKPPSDRRRGPDLSSIDLGLGISRGRGGGDGGGRGGGGGGGVDTESDDDIPGRTPPELTRRSDAAKPPGFDVDDRNAELLYRYGYGAGFRDRSGLLPIDLAFGNRLHAILPPVPRNDDNRAPRPYNFAYVSPTEAGGAHARSEVSDAAGRRVGFYTIRQPNGHVRRVNYIADHNGFRAEVLTNEPGTDNQNTAGAIFRSSAALPYAERYSPPGVPPSSLPPSRIPVTTPHGTTAHGLPGHLSPLSPLAVTPSGLPLSPSEVARPINPLRYPSGAELEARYRFPAGSLFPDLRMRYVRIPDGFRAVLVPLHS